MAHFAELDSNNKVIRVLVVGNEDVGDLQFPESEQLGINFLLNLFPNTIWKQTSYNSNFRKNYASINGTYNAKLDAFIPEKIYSSWILNEESCLWEPPVPYPTDDKFYTWDETKQNWLENITGE